MDEITTPALCFGNKRSMCGSGLQHTALLGGVHVRPQDPLVLRFLLVERAELHLVQLQLEARATLLQLHLASCHLEDVVTERHKVVVVGQRDNALGVRLGHWEQVLEDVGNALSQRRLELVDNEYQHQLLVSILVPGSPRVSVTNSRSVKSLDLALSTNCSINKQQISELTSQYSDASV
ncbi:hypothetical protein GQ600_16022 [Phytophthora cactorum]|nr:hypothetical protein GQ600_16022 [Phytophthora cactorum]